MGEVSVPVVGIFGWRGLEDIFNVELKDRFQSRLSGFLVGEQTAATASLNAYNRFSPGCRDFWLASNSDQGEPEGNCTFQSRLSGFLVGELRLLLISSLDCCFSPGCRDFWLASRNVAMHKDATYSFSPGCRDFWLAR